MKQILNSSSFEKDCKKILKLIKKARREYKAGKTIKAKSILELLQ